AAGMQQGEVKPVAVEIRRDVHAVSNAELAVALLGVEAPDLVALEVDADQVAGAEVAVHVLAVGAGRRRSVVAFAAHVATAAAAGQLALPELLAVSADAQEHEVAALLTGQEDAVAPNDRGGAGHAGHGQPPGDVLGG